MSNFIEEFAKCREDFRHFVETYIKVIHSTKGLVPMKLHEFQKEFIKHLDEHRFVATIKFRQGGFSTLSVLYGMWQAWFHGKKVLFYSKTDREAIHLGRIVYKALQHLPDWFVPKMSTNNDHSKHFDNMGGEMNFWSLQQAAKGKSQDFIFIDEAAFIPNMEEKWQAAYSMITGEQSKCFITSTVNGIRGHGNWFYELCKKSEEGKNQFFLYRPHYKEHPEYQNENWEARMKENLGELGWHQEILGDFLGTETFSERITRNIKNNWVKGINFTSESGHVINLNEDQITNLKIKKGGSFEPYGVKELTNKELIDKIKPLLKHVNSEYKSLLHQMMIRLGNNKY